MKLLTSLFALLPNASFPPHPLLPPAPLVAAGSLLSPKASKLAWKPTSESLTTGGWNKSKQKVSSVNQTV